jgi:FixJ family two-component response regulator
LDQKDITSFIVDDDESVRRALKRLIKAEGRGDGLISIEQS